MRTREIFFTILFFVVLLGSSCADQSEVCPEGTKVTLTASDLDGCSWLLVDNDDNRFEAINLTTFDIVLEDGKEFSITYTEADAASICMSGTIIELTCLKEL